MDFCCLEYCILVNFDYLCISKRIFMATTPGLFAQTQGKSSRDYSKEKAWGKNMFNSSFPASLVTYMSYKKVDPVYLKTENSTIIHSFISGKDLFRIDPLSECAYFNYEAGFSSFDKFYVGDREKNRSGNDRQANESRSYWFGSQTHSAS